MTEKKMVKAEERRPEKKFQAKARMKNMVMFLPNMIRLCGNLLTDKRVPVAEKALFAGRSFTRSCRWILFPTFCLLSDRSTTSI
jgi:hypothetical protein